MKTQPDVPDAPLLSVVVPVYNEAENVRPLAEEITASLKSARVSFEVVFVNDSSVDATADRLAQLEAEGLIRFISHTLNAGQSAAIVTGFQWARGAWVATLDGDGQNDPADLPGMLSRALAEKVDCVTGVRKKRRDVWLKRVSSKIANGFRNWVTGDCVTDSGCGIRVVRRGALREIPVFNGTHRFLPTLLRAQGFTVVEHTVNHRERVRGVSKYGMHNRLWRGLRDCFGIRWYLRRAVPSMRLAREA